VFRLEVIDFVDNSNQAIVARVPESGTAAIQYGAQLIVQQNQEAVFFRDGRAMDRFGPGRYTLTTANVPVITRILTSPWEKSPFQACVYFIGKHLFADERWGTRQPITLRDKDFGIVRLRGYGKFAFRVVDSELLINTLIGTQGKYTTEEVSSYLKDIIVAAITDLLATSGISLLDLPARFDELSAAARVKLAAEFAKFGLELNQFLISNISPPEEVQKAIDARSSMSVVGDLRSFTVYQAAKGMEKLGDGGGSVAGIGMGMMVPGMIASAMNAIGQKASQRAGSGQAGLDFSELKALPSSSNPRAIVENLVKQSGWSVESQDQDHLVIMVPLGATRRQRVNVEFNQKDNEGNAKVSVWSVCGPMSASSATTLLRYNDQLIHGAFALRRQGDGEQVVLRTNMLADTTDALELSRSISSIAWQADQVEMQLSGVDAN
jgi:membrane protease subunit (stomatin/prohibitin family)